MNVSFASSQKKSNGKNYGIFNNTECRKTFSWTQMSFAYAYKHMTERLISNSWPITMAEFREISNFERQQICTNPQQQGNSKRYLIEGRDGAVKEAWFSQLSVSHLKNFPHQIVVPRFLYRAHSQRRAPPESWCQVLIGQQTVPDMWFSRCLSLHTRFWFNMYIRCISVF